MLLFCLLPLVFAQEPVDQIALLQAEATSQGIAIRFSDRLFAETQVYRRSLGAGEKWEDAEMVADLGQESRWFDSNISVGERWEYFVVRNQTAKGFVAGGIEADLLDEPGKIAVVVEEGVGAELQPELQQLTSDLVAEGWSVVQFSVAQTDSVVDVKALLQGEDDLEAALLIGHVPVPYSGLMAPDGHISHYGAWSADTYYGDLSNQWTDETQSNTSASRSQNHNIPGDGKFDQNNIPSDVDLQIGRVDMFDLPAFEETEVQLLQRYFARNHAWRMGQVSAIPAAVIDDNFGTYAPGSYSAWLLSPVVGRDNLEEGDFWETLAAEPYLFGFGSGAGSYSHCDGVGKTQDFADEVLQGVFLMLFGSYFGDFDSTDNFLRAAIAGEGNALSVVWGGRPVHRHHALGIGETIGYAVRDTQNAWEMMVNNSNTRKVHVALLGDPTLRAFPLQPVSEVKADSDGPQGQVAISWNDSADSEVLGVHVYRSASEEGPYTRVSNAIVEENTFTDSVELEGDWWWMVRAIKLQETASGSFYNPSAGVAVSLEVVFEPVDSAAGDSGGGGEGDTGDSGEKDSTGCGCASQSQSGGLWMFLGLIGLVHRRRT